MKNWNPKDFERVVNAAIKYRAGELDYQRGIVSAKQASRNGRELDLAIMMAVRNADRISKH